MLRILQGTDEAKLFDEFSQEINTKERRSSEEIKKAIATAAKLSSNIKDVCDELKILRRIAKYQESVQDKMNTDGSVLSDRSAAHIVEDIEELDKTADRIQGAVRLCGHP